MPDTKKESYEFTKIPSLDIPELEIYRKLNEIQLRKINEPKPGIFICESSKVILRALASGYEIVSILTAVSKPNDETKEVYQQANGAPIYLGDDSILRELAGYALTDGVLAAMKRKELPSLDSILEGKKVVAVLENVNNPTNIGAIFRSAAALNIEAIIITFDSSDPFYRRAERVSMGTVFQLPYTRLDRGEDYLTTLSKHGFKTVAMALSDEAISIDDKRLKNEEKIAVILGNEGYGLKDETIANSDYVAMIPMNPLVDSLNVAAASAVTFWELQH
ncbi:MAG: RNA methyltransferase [Lachnospiraceae bacterium]|nr:RNA methyltransferase [Lachnospiraceae bacterium]